MSDFLLVEAMNAACFKDESTIAAQMSWCGKALNTDGSSGITALKFNPLMQKSSAASYYT